MSGARKRHRPGPMARACPEGERRLYLVAPLALFQPKLQPTALLRPFLTNPYGATGSRSKLGTEDQAVTHGIPVSLRKAAQTQGLPDGSGL
jgi:hypothetical protein